MATTDAGLGAARGSFEMTKKAKKQQAPGATAAGAPPAARAPALAGPISASEPGEAERRAERELRFEADRAAAAAADASGPRPLLRAVGVGSSTATEKAYSRLTAAPAADSVRPPSVLRDALLLVKRRWRERADYACAREQLKSIRQDLTVQRVGGALAVDAYETHARCALEAGDAAEYAQCAAVLRALHAEGGGAAGCPAEFCAYRLLSAASAGGQAFFLEMRSMPPGLAGHPCVAHAVASCRAYRTGDAVGFFRLFRTAPRMSAYLLDALTARVRSRALAALLAACRPGVPVAHLARTLGFESDAAAADWAQAQGATVVEIDGEPHAVRGRDAEAAGTGQGGAHAAGGTAPAPSADAAGAAPKLRKKKKPRRSKPG